MQGIRFGIAVACLTVIPTYLIYHVVTPVPLALAIKQIVFDTIRVVLMGIVLAWINRYDCLLQLPAASCSYQDKTSVDCSILPNIVQRDGACREHNRR